MKRFGFPGLVELPLEIRFTSAGGFASIRTWTGPDQLLLAAMSSLKSSASDMVYRQGEAPAKSLLNATFTTLTGVGGGSSESQVESIWELDDDSNEASIWQLPKVQAIFSGYTAEEMGEIRADVERYANGTIQNSEFGDLIVGLLATNTDFQELVKRLYRTNNQDTYYAPKGVIRHTLTGPSSWRYTFDFDSVAKSTTSAAIVSSETTLNIPLPSSRYWLTQFPRLYSTNRGKLQVIREWKEIENDTWKYTALA